GLARRVGICEAAHVGTPERLVHRLCGRGGLLRAARADDDGITCPRPPPSEAGADISGAAEDGDGRLCVAHSVSCLLPGPCVARITSGTTLRAIASSSAS